MDIYEVVKKLIGNINPVGETNTDNERFENLKTATELVDKLLTDIDAVATNNEGRVEYSMNRAGKHAAEFFNKLGIVE